MVDYRTWMKIGMEQCAPDGPGSQDERREVFSDLAEGWNEYHMQIREMDEAEVRERIECP